LYLLQSHLYWVVSSEKKPSRINPGRLFFATDNPI
jgi:hypothetical protein